ncbi:protein kinase domain-containing protein [Streptomyces sp. NPDC004749]
MTTAEETPQQLTALGPDDPREISGYRLLAKVGEGGMGTVYLSSTRGGQPVALKLIRRDYARHPDFRARFEREVQAARRVSGYHIVPVLDHDTRGEEPWIATAYVPGLALDDVLDRFGPLPLSVTFQIIGCTARALSAVHSASVIHRDLKPSNVLLGSDGPWVIDFGIARATDTTQLTRTGGVVGTPQYMSPEHALSQSVTGATDIFALGLIAAVVATGRHPYGDGSGISIATAIANTEQRPPDLSGYPEALRQLLTGCLAADPASRPTPAALADWCEEASGRALRDFTDWLPAPLADEIARLEESAAHPPGASGGGGGDAPAAPAVMASAPTGSAGAASAGAGPAPASSGDASARPAAYVPTQVVGAPGTPGAAGAPTRAVHAPAPAVLRAEANSPVAYGAGTTASVAAGPVANGPVANGPVANALAPLTRRIPLARLTPVVRLVRRMNLRRWWPWWIAGTVFFLALGAVMEWLGV